MKEINKNNLKFGFGFRFTTKKKDYTWYFINVFNNFADNIFCFLSFAKLKPNH